MKNYYILLIFAIVVISGCVADSDDNNDLTDDVVNTEFDVWCEQFITKAEFEDITGRQFLGTFNVRLDDNYVTIYGNGWGCELKNYDTEDETIVDAHIVEYITISSTVNPTTQREMEFWRSAGNDRDLLTVKPGVYKTSKENVYYSAEVFVPIDDRTSIRATVLSADDDEIEMFEQRLVELVNLVIDRYADR